MMSPGSHKPHSTKLVGWGVWVEVLACNCRWLSVSPHHNASLGCSCVDVYANIRVFDYVGLHYNIRTRTTHEDASIVVDFVASEDNESIEPTLKVLLWPWISRRALVISERCDGPRFNGLAPAREVWPRVWICARIWKRVVIPGMVSFKNLVINERHPLVGSPNVTLCLSSPCRQTSSTPESILRSNAAQGLSIKLHRPSIGVVVSIECDVPNKWNDCDARA